MARLSIEDMNNLSGVSEEDLDKLYKQFRAAHTKIFNDINKWISLCDKALEYLNKLDNTYDNDIIVHKTAKEMYYKGSLILDDVDLFEYYTHEYQSILTKLNNNKMIGNTMVLLEILKNNKQPVVNRLSECYGMYSEAYDRLNKEDTYEG